MNSVDIIMFPLQATVFFSNNRALFNGSMFARGVWSCFPMLDYEERWRASINLSSYQRVLCRSNQDGFVPLCVIFCRWHHFPLCSSYLCFVSSTFPSPLPCWVFDSGMLSHDCLPQCSMHLHSNISRTDV